MKTLEVRVTENTKLNGVEVRFNTIPDKKLRDAMKKNGFKFTKSNGDARWYASNSAEHIKFANSLKGEKSVVKAKLNKAKVNGLDGYEIKTHGFILGLVKSDNKWFVIDQKSGKQVMKPKASRKACIETMTKEYFAWLTSALAVA